MIFEKSEYSARLDNVRAAMRAREIDLLIVDQSEFLIYLTGFSISENMYRACLVPLNGEPVMVLRAVDLGPFEDSSWLDQAVAFADWEHPVAVMAKTIHDMGFAARRVGIDEESYCMPLKRFRQLEGLLPDTKFVDFSGVLECLRARKSDAEIALIRQAARIADLGISAAVEDVGEGRSARDAAAVVHQVFMKEGADTSRAGIITAGVGNNFLHGYLTDTSLKSGEILHLELLPFVQGYSARIMRPVVIGPLGERARVAELLLEIQDRQFAAMKPGATACDVDAIAREGLLAAGLRPDYLNITGYNLGLYPIHTPRTSDFTRIFLPTSKWQLEPGMVFHMYVSASGLAFSETILITEHGFERLTQSPRKVFEA
ncbi:Xaa-Pro peptidase family protein [Microvirga sp. VF16]|uniref:M24 family metallopeptidase n=1 Tax=Microvirga sp. VF16 TaxID=2807101 RepID=UPI00193D026A|nr:Xaa-Pro peptidase family protein [Microvirga sp. VF16]QRM33075.1 aminopeptidase P family protein [Microvirga sp. VF16]